ncbi:MAG: glucose-6-phosphate isomerase [Candidatus Kapabacteria bacterium]|nr:glucose-6-phosphate isomerase [Candidatus Kapabacteria bacterium]
MEVINKTAPWAQLLKLADDAKTMSLRHEFESDQSRFDKFHVLFKDFLFDYSKNLINENIIEELYSLASEAGLKDKIEQMFTGIKINNTEHRAVLHTALRNFGTEPVLVDNFNVMPEIKRILEKIKIFTDKFHSAEISGFNGKKFTDIVNIGIGGSDLGPAMVCEALKHYAIPDLKVHFVSNVDGAHISETLKRLNYETTLFIIASKTFTTQETMTNAQTAKNWFLSHSNTSQDDISKHFVALSTNKDAVQRFGINLENMFEFWDWVGGRYSLWSAIGLSISLFIGYNNFEELLKGAYDADIHFRNEQFNHNIPVIMALIGIWYRNFLDIPTYAIIPYSQYLSKLPEFLQQLDMESNGKCTDKNSLSVEYQTGPVIWGSAGTNSQHSFFQLIHQSTQKIASDFIAFVHNLGNENFSDFIDHHEKLLSNFFAQTEALMRGKTESEITAELRNQGKSDDEINEIKYHKIFAGNKPSNSILIKNLNPRNLGTLIAFYEHKVLVQGIIWNVNPFDQWGVELGKQLAGIILPELKSDNKVNSHDCSTNNLINFYKTNKNTND